MIDICDAPEQIAALAKLVVEYEGSEENLKQLQDAFETSYPDWLATQVDYADSSDHLQEMMDVLINSAEALQLNAVSLELSEAETRIQELATKEDSEADAGEEEWRMRKHEEVIESRQIDDILGSLI